jgi:hypothetical protein
MNRQRGFFVFAIAISYCLSFSREASANTLVMVLRGEEASIIAADSKVASVKGNDLGAACKIHVSNNIAWASSGFPIDPYRGISLEAVGDEAINRGGSFDQIVLRFESAAKEWLATFLSRLRQTEPDLYDRAIDVTPKFAVSVVLLQKNFLKSSDFIIRRKDAPENVEVDRAECPGAGCPSGNGRLFMGTFDAANAELERNPGMWDQKGIVGGMNYLIGVQLTLRPQQSMPQFLLDAWTKAALGLGCKKVYVLSNMSAKRDRKPDDPAQYKRFVEAAKEAQADETEEGADKAFKKVAAKKDSKPIRRPWRCVSPIDFCSPKLGRKIHCH